MLNLEGTLKLIHDNIYEVDTILFIRYGIVEYAYLRSPYGKRTIWSCFTVQSRSCADIIRLILNKRIVDSDNGYSISVLDNQPCKFNYPKVLFDSWDRTTFKRVYGFCRYHLTTKKGSTFILGINTEENKYWYVDDVILKYKYAPENKFVVELLHKYCDVKNITALTELFCNNIYTERDTPISLDTSQIDRKCRGCGYNQVKHSLFGDVCHCMSSKKYIECFPNEVQE